MYPYSNTKVNIDKVKSLNALIYKLKQAIRALFIYSESSLL